MSIGKKMKWADILTIVNGKNQRQVECSNGAYPIYGSGGVIGHAKDYLCPENTVIIGRKGSINKPIFSSSKLWNVDTAFGLVAKPDTLLPRYLFHFCEYYDFEKLNTTVTIPSLTKANLLNIEMPVPDLTTQTKMAKRLDGILHITTLRKQQIQVFDRLASSRFVEMFGDPLKNPKRWETQSLGELTDIVRGGSPRPIDNFLGGTIPWIKIGDATQGDDIYLHSTRDCITEAGLTKTRYIKRGSLIFANCGVSLGFARIITFDGCIHDGWLALGNISDRLNKVFLLKSLNYCTDYFRRSAPDGTQPNLNTSIMKNFLQILPPLTLQNEFAAFIEQLDKSKVTIQRSLDKLNQTYRALLQQYFG